MVKMIESSRLKKQTEKKNFDVQLMIFILLVLFDHRSPNMTAVFDSFFHPIL